MPMPHRTFAQVAKRRLTGKEGRERVREVNSLLAELPDYKNGPYADLRKWLLSRDRGHPRPRECGPPRLDRGPARGSGADRAGRAAERRQVLAAPGPVRDPDQDRRLPVHHAPARAGADADRWRPRAIGRDPGVDRRCERRPWWRPGFARRPADGRRDRLLLPSERRSGRARGRHRRGRQGRHREAGPPRRHPRG